MCAPGETLRREFLRWGGFCCLAGWLWGMIGDAWATHRVDHRFTVYGQVRDEQGRPIKGAKVRVVDTTIGIQQETFTDALGRYRVVLHLHNPNLGDQLEIRVGNQVQQAKVVFDPQDRVTERMVRVDFGRPPQGRSGTWILWGMTGVLALLGAAYWIRGWRHRVSG